MVIFNACQSSLTYDIYDYGDEFELAKGEGLRVGAENTSVKFVGVVQDSRCPIYVMCVWAGNWKVRIQFIDQELQLNTCKELHDTTISERKIELLSLNPYPEYPRQFEKEDYKIWLLITKE